MHLIGLHQAFSVHPGSAIYMVRWSKINTLYLQLLIAMCMHFMTASEELGYS
jgi:hypothetical protein